MRSKDSRQEHQDHTIGDLTYDAEQQVLRHGERCVFLTLCESKIVAYLFRHPGVHISADELLRISLRSKARQKTTAIETRICGIRKKIAKIGTMTTIRTTRYQGYIIG